MKVVTPVLVRFEEFLRNNACPNALALLDQHRRRLQAHSKLIASFIKNPEETVRQQEQPTTRLKSNS